MTHTASARGRRQLAKRSFLRRILPAPVQPRGTILTRLMTDDEPMPDFPGCDVHSREKWPAASHQQNLNAVDWSHCAACGSCTIRARQNIPLALHIPLLCSSHMLPTGQAVLGFNYLVDSSLNNLLPSAVPCLQTTDSNNFQTAHVSMTRSEQIVVLI